MTLTSCAALVSISVAVFLAGLKTWGTLQTHTMTLGALVVDSLLDVLASGINYTFILRSRKPADAAYPYGYGKSESIAAFSESYIIGFSAVLLGYKAIDALVRPWQVGRIDTGILILVISWIVTLGLTIFLGEASQRTGSIALRADSFHYRTDLLTNLGGIISLGILKVTGFAKTDGLFSILIAGYMLHGALRIGRQSVRELMDRTLLPEENRRILGIIERFHPALGRPHDFRSRRSGSSIFIEFHIEIDRHMDFNAAHDLTEDLIEAIREEIRDAKITVHVDPRGTNR